MTLESKRRIGYSGEWQKWLVNSNKKTEVFIWGWSDREWKKMDPLLENNTLIVSIRNTIFLNKNIGVYRISTSRLFLV